MKYRVAYIDENGGWINTISKTLEPFFDIIKVKVTCESRIDQIINDLFETGIDAIITDYLLEEEEDTSFNGDLIVEELRKSRPYFPLVMLTSYEKDAIAQMEDVHIIYDKDIFNGELDNAERLNCFINRVQTSIDSYYVKYNNIKTRFEELSLKRSQETLTAFEEEELTKLYLRMEEFDPDNHDIFLNWLSSSAISQFSTFVEETKSILKELKKR